MCSNKNIEVNFAISARDDNHAHFEVSHPDGCLVSIAFCDSRPGEKEWGVAVIQVV